MGWGYNCYNSRNWNYSNYPRRRFVQTSNNLRQNTNCTPCRQTGQRAQSSVTTQPQATGNVFGQGVQQPVQKTNTPVVQTNKTQSGTNTTAQTVTTQPAAKDIYKSNNPYATIARCYTGDYNQIYNKCVTQGAQQGAQHGATIGSSKGFGGLITRAATRIGGNQGYQQGVQQGAQTAAKLENSLRQFANAKPEDAQKAIAKFQNNLKSIDAAAQAQIRNTYAQHGLCAPANCGNAELQQAATQMGQLAQIPLPVANELVNQSPDKLRSTLDELQKAGESKVKQATVLAKNCPNALSGMVKDALSGSMNVSNDSNPKYDFQNDMKENGGELLNALANLPQDTKQEIENAVIDTFREGMQQAIGNDFSLDKILTKENLEIAKGVIENNPQAVAKLMEEVSNTLDKLPNNSIEKPDFEQLVKIGKVYKALEESGILNSLKETNPEAYEKIQNKFFALNKDTTPHTEDDGYDMDNVFS